MTEKNKDHEAAPAPAEVLSRRKLVYVAPMLMSKRMFYRATQCGKVHGGAQSPCTSSPKTS